MLKRIVLGLGILAVACGGGEPSSPAANTDPGDVSSSSADEAASEQQQAASEVAKTDLASKDSAQGVASSAEQTSGSGVSQGGSGGQAPQTTLPNGGSGGQSNSNACSPTCGDRKCGPDPLCGESCGICAAGTECVAGECRAPTPLAENGSTCSSNGECASNFCAQSVIGERRCYGTGGANDVCGDSFDCSGGSCLQSIPGNASTVCVPGIDQCYQRDVSAPCRDYVVAFCQLIQVCGSNVSSSIPAEYANFDYCIGSECNFAGDGISDLTPTQCTQGAAGILSGTLPCP